MKAFKVKTITIQETTFSPVLEKNGKLFFINNNEGTNSIEVKRKGLNLKQEYKELKISDHILMCNAINGKIKFNM